MSAKAPARLWQGLLGQDLTNPKVILLFWPSCRNSSIPRAARCCHSLIYGAACRWAVLSQAGPWGVFAAGAAGRMAGNLRLARFVGWISAAYSGA